ncbi:hypothetical protein, partial [Thiorhodococcus mannitoliphagus]|uniref:hypothetical protein n=1 Tax=Thiorhodococcus mannitoliphagus TaxID=329406 RepID=UPI001981CA90
SVGISGVLVDIRRYRLRPSAANPFESVTIDRGLAEPSRQGSKMAKVEFTMREKINEGSSFGVRAFRPPLIFSPHDTSSS